MKAEELDKAIQERGFLVVSRDVQLAWIASLGWTRTYFLVHIVLAFLLTPVAYWIGYQTTFGDKVVEALAQPDLASLSVLVLTGMRLFNWMCLAMPFCAIVAFFVVTFTGMFQKQFWLEVAQLNTENSDSTSNFTSVSNFDK